MLKENFVPVAFDQWYLRQQKDEDGDFYRKIAGQGPRRNFDNTTQGFYIAEPDGKLYFYNNNRGPKRIKALMKAALRDFKPGDFESIESKKIDKRFARQPPEGSQTLRVRSQILGGYGRTNDPWQRIFQTAISRDNLWVLKDELKALEKGRFPEQLAMRIARFHLVDNTRGEPPMWNRDDVKSVKIGLENNQIRGALKLENADQSRQFDVHLFGKLEWKAGKITKFDLVARGLHEGEGRWTRGAPKGKFPLAIAFQLADGKDPADSVAPQGTKGWLRGYIEP